MTDYTLARLTRRACLQRVGLVCGLGLLAACAPAAPASPTSPPAPTAAPPAPTAAPKPTAAAAAPTAAKPAPTTAPAPAPTAAAAPTTTAPPGAKRGGKITWAVPSLPNLLPSGAVAQPPTHVLMYSSLLEWDRELKNQPALAESYQAVDDKTYVFKLRQGVKFHDGSEVTSDAVKYSLDLHRNPPPPGQAFSFYPKIATVEAVDKYTVRINLTDPDPALVGFVTWTRYSPIFPVGMYDKVNFLTSGIGSGPYKIGEFVADDHANLTRFADYWNTGLPYIDEIDVKVLADDQARVAGLRSGAVDVAADMAPDIANTLKNDSNLTILTGLEARYLEIQFTTKGADKKPWYDQRVRQAMNFAINRQDVAEKVYGGEAEVSSIMPTGFGDWPLSIEDLKNTYVKFDLAKAQQLMADAGFANGFEVTCQTFSAPQDYAQAAQVVAEQMKQIKINMTVQPLEPGTFAKNNGEGGFDMQLTGRGFRHDPSGYVNEFNPTSAIYPLWFGDGWKNDQLTNVISSALRTADVAKRHQLYTQAQQILLTELVHIPIVQPKAYTVVSKRMQNMAVSFTADPAYVLRDSWVTS